MEKKKTLKLGSFKVTPKSLEEKVYAYLIESASKNYRLEVNFTSALFQIIDKWYDDDTMWEYLDCVVSMNYQMSQCVPDFEFMTGYAELMTALFKRVDTGKASEDDESEEDILLAERAKQVIREADELNGTDMTGEIERTVEEEARKLLDRDK